MSMIKIWEKTFAFLYLISIILYISQGILYEGTWFTFLAGVYLFGYEVLCTLWELLKKKHPAIFNIVSFFLLWIIFIWSLSPKHLILYGESISTTTMIQYIVMICCAIPTFYRIGLNRLLSERLLSIFAIAIGIIFVYNVLHFDVTSLEAGEYNYSSANNKSYALAALFPFFLLFWKRKWLMLSLMIASMIFVVFLLKRGSMLCVAASLMTVFFYVFKENSSNRRARFYKILIRIIILALIGGLTYVLFNIYQENDILQARLEHGSSNRDEIFSKLWNIWVSSDLYIKIVGNGPLSTATLIKYYAHNDWLQILIDFGFIGLLLYVTILMSVIKFFIKSKLNSQQKASLIVCLIYIILRGSFSMCIYELDSILVFGFLGYTIGKKVNNNKKLIYEDIINS